MRDSIDFKNMDIAALFRKLLLPTVLGMIFSALFVITDGIFVGKGIGSDALAAVNIVAPLWLFSTGIGLMFGVGASVVASIHLSHNKPKTARINITQSIVVSSLLLMCTSTLFCLFAPQVVHLLGSSERLKPLAVEYMCWFVPFSAFTALLNSGMFFLRLDGSPNFAMFCNIVASVLNIILDYLFIFPFGWGMFGAAFASAIGTTVGALMIIIYLSRRNCALRFYPVKFSRNSMKLMKRNVGYMCRLGSSAFLCEVAIACMMFVGNLVFIHYLKEDGVAAFSIACYFFPIIFMVYNAIAQSAQPIISFNYGLNETLRVRKTYLLALKTAVGCGICFALITIFCSREIVANAGKEGAVVVQKVREGKGDFGYNARTDVYENLHAAGVVDPAKVTRVALENAASIAGMFLTTECVIVEKKEDKPEMPMGAPGMGGMGGMM